MRLYHGRLFLSSGTVPHANKEGTHTVHRLRSLIPAVLVAALLALPASSLGATPNFDVGAQTAASGQGTANCAIENCQPKQRIESSVSQDGKGSLPFTGLDLALIVVAGTGLLGMGFGLRRMTQRQPLG